MNDENKACLLIITWTIISFLACATGTKAGVIAAGFLTAILVLILYSSWLIDRTERRLRRYMEHANEDIRNEQEEGEPYASRENVREQS